MPISGSNNAIDNPSASKRASAARHADRFHDRLKVELFREGLAHLVHDRELGYALTYLGRGADAAQRRADVLPDERQQANVVIGVELAGLIGLHDERPEGRSSARSGTPSQSTPSMPTIAMSPSAVSSS